MLESVKEIRWCNDIGMFAIDRPIDKSCIWKTEECEETCFNNKLYKLYPNMHKKDIRNEAEWSQINGTALRNTLKRKKKQTKRVRLMTRGESFDSVASVLKVKDLLIKNPDTEFWLITRSWRDMFIADGDIFAAVMEHIRPLHNARLLMSLDKTNSREEWIYLTKVLRLSTMFYDAGKRESTPVGGKWFRCPKTFKGLKGHCEICKAGCFNTKKRVDVYLKQH